MTSEWGKQRRLARLRNPTGEYLLAALDHGFTFGPIDGIREIASCASVAQLSGVSGVVLNRGLVTRISPDAAPGLILQTFGCPDIEHQGVRKIPVATIRDAVRLSVDAIAVELDLNVNALPKAVRAATTMIGKADANSLPVLSMMTPMRSREPCAALAQAIRVATEMGSDLIKVGIPDDLLTTGRQQLREVHLAVRGAAPVLLAGGAATESMQLKLDMSRELGFSGVCIGRNLFQAKNPKDLIEEVQTRFGGETL
jgi:DhnA family fructose-bisphosphate aldolase class Ia